MLDLFLPLARRISHHARGIRRGAGVPTPAPWAGIAPPAGDETSEDGEASGFTLIFLLHICTHLIDLLTVKHERSINLRSRIVIDRPARLLNYIESVEANPILTWVVSSCASSNFGLLCFRWIVVISCAQLWPACLHGFVCLYS